MPIHITTAEDALGAQRVAHFKEHLGLTDLQQQALVKWVQARGLMPLTILVDMYEENEKVVVPELKERIPKKTVLDFFRQTAHLLGGPA